MASNPEVDPNQDAPDRTEADITEELLWRFIDGDLADEEEDMVAERIADDEAVGNLYLELLETHDQFAGFFKERQKEQGATSFSTMLGTIKDIAN